METVTDTGPGVNCGCSADGHGQRIYRCRLHASAPRLREALAGWIMAAAMRGADVPPHIYGWAASIAGSAYISVTEVTEAAIKEASDA